MTYDWSHSCLQRGGVWKIIEYTHHHRPTFEKQKRSPLFPHSDTPSCLKSLEIHSFSHDYMRFENARVGRNCRVSARRLEPYLVASCQCFRDVVPRRLQRPELRVDLWVVVEATCKLADGSSVSCAASGSLSE